MSLVKNVCGAVCKNLLSSNSTNALNLFGSAQQIRGTRKHVRPVRIRYPMWWLQMERAKCIDNLTKDNKSFIQEVLHDKFGAPVDQSGIQTYPAASPLKAEPLPHGEWKWPTRRVGLIVRKIGVYPMWEKDGTRIATTLFHVIDNHVVKYIPPDEFDPIIKKFLYKKRNMACLLVGAESADPQKFTKEYCGLFETAGLMPKKKLCRFVVSPEAALQAGTPLYASHFNVGDYVDIRGKTLDRGFQGVVYRWKFRGQPKTHGSTKTHNRPGNIGGGGEKARVWPGKKLPGHMGNRWRMHRGVQIVRINTKYNVIYVRGQASPGEVGSISYMYDTILPYKRRNEAPPFPTFFPDQLDEPLPEELYAEEMHKFDDPSIQWEPEKITKDAKKKK